MHRIYFLTSSRTKFTHARHLARTYDVEIVPKVQYGIAYEEPKVSDREELLLRSFEDAKRRWSRNVSADTNAFFIEDTSVIVDALSQEGHEIPGLNVKFWMRQVSFEELDKLLKRSGNNRAVTVRSDVLLYLPPDLQSPEPVKPKFLQFTGYTSGSIVDAEFEVTTNVVHPWLDSTSFNKWFVPDGECAPLSMLPIEIADKHDIRRDSVGAMFDFLVRHHLINLRGRDRPVISGLTLPFEWPPLALVCGLPCAGKTTIGTMLSERYGYYHLEASDFMRVAYLERHGLDSELRIDEFAAAILIGEPDVVVSQVLREIDRHRDHPVVITGFRAMQEVEIFTRSYNGELRTEKLFVDSEMQLRFRRSLIRDREDALKTIEEFKARDEVQLQMGLSKISSSSTFKLQSNTGRIATLDQSIRKKLNITQQTSGLDRPTNTKPVRLEDRILITLASKQADPGYFTTTQISYLVREVFGDARPVTNKNNISRYFNQHFRPYYRVKRLPNGKFVYRISSTGISKARLIARSYSESD